MRPARNQKDDTRLTLEKERAALSNEEETLSILKMKKHELEEHVSGTETEEDGARLVLEKERAALSDAEKAVSILKTEKHQLEERVSSAEQEWD